MSVSKAIYIFKGLDSVTEYRPCRLLLGKPIIERRVLMERKVVYSHAGHLEDGGLASQDPSPRLRGGSVL